VSGAGQESFGFRFTVILRIPYLSLHGSETVKEMKERAAGEANGEGIMFDNHWEVESGAKERKNET